MIGSMARSKSMNESQQNDETESLDSMDVALQMFMSTPARIDGIVL